VHATLADRYDERFLRVLVAWLMWQHEVDEPIPCMKADSAPTFIDAMLHNIVDIDLTITSLVGKSELGRIKETHDRLSIGVISVRSAAHRRRARKRR
jgi:predicted FMN-binding regulatory protein PaiB